MFRINKFIKKGLACIVIAVNVLNMSLVSFANPLAETNGQIEDVKSFEWPEAPEIVGEAAIIMEAETGAILYQKDAYSKMYPASITKIITAIVAIENSSIDDIVTASEYAINSLPWDASKLPMEIGEELTFTDALYGLILKSGNDVANALAEHVVNKFKEKDPNSTTTFESLMTEYAKKAGALNTNFSNPHGLHEDDHYTTAYDMAMIVKSATKNELFAKVWGSGSYLMSATNKYPKDYTIRHTHQLLREDSPLYYEYAIGGKTGYTDEAQRTLVTHSKKGDMSIITVVLKSTTKDIFNDTMSLVNYAFDNFEKAKISDIDPRFEEATDRLSNIFGCNKEDKLVKPIAASFEDLKVSVDLFNSVANSGVAGEVTYSFGEYYLGKTSMLMSAEKEQIIFGEAANTMPEEEEEDNILIINVKYVLAGMLVLLGIVMLFMAIRKMRINHAKRNRYAKKNKRRDVWR